MNQEQMKALLIRDKGFLKELYEGKDEHYQYFRKS
jgi:hypothetical protein